METPNLNVQQKHCREDTEHQLPTVEEIMNTYHLDDPRVAAEIRRWKERRIRWPWAFEDDRPRFGDVAHNPSALNS
ncbi:MAG: hypothetical protein ACYTEQ_04110 [Planctomycetota bacterium]